MERAEGWAGQVRGADDATAHESSGADAARWPLVLIVVLAFTLVASLWAAVLFKVAAEERAELAAIERRTTNLARVFEEHTVRTLASVDQALLFVKFQYEKVGAALDIASAVEQGMIVSTLFNQVGVIDAQGIYSLSNLPGFKRVTSPIASISASMSTRTRVTSSSASRCSGARAASGRCSSPAASTAPTAASAGWR